MNRTRCPWAGEDPLYVRYHDREWGVPLHEERRLFEFLVLRLHAGRGHGERSRGGLLPV